VTHSLASSSSSSRRWDGHRLLASAVAAVALVVPGVAGVLVALAVPTMLASNVHSGGARALVWLAAVLGGVGTTVAMDRALRRFLPLAVLLRLSLDFPDRAPSRLRMALRAGTLRNVHAQLADVAVHGVDGDPTQAARTILELMAALSRYDRRTRGHSERVRAFTDVIADQLDLPRLDRDRLRWAALLHDIGKLHVDVGVLNKAGRLDGEEWEAVRAHPHVGARIAAPLLPWLGDWGSAIEHHHERWDGRGYPHGCAGTEIPLGARIVAVADAFEVMTAVRSYKRPMSVEAARTELLACAGEQFDPHIVRALLAASLTRLRWIIGPAALLALFPRTGVASGLQGRLRDVPLVRAGVAALFAALSLPAVDVPFGRGEAAQADDTEGRTEATASTVAGSAFGATSPFTSADVLAALPRGERLAIALADLRGTGWPRIPSAPAAGAAGTSDPTAAPATTPEVVDGSTAPEVGAAPQEPSASPSPSPSSATPATPHGGRPEARPKTVPPGSIVSDVARSGGGTGHGEAVSSTARTTAKPAGAR
jgi:putative nucleotidyltransferase with HDIG domain